MSESSLDRVLWCLTLSADPLGPLGCNVRPLRIGLVLKPSCWIRLRSVKFGCLVNVSSQNCSLVSLNNLCNIHELYRSQVKYFPCFPTLQGSCWQFDPLSGLSAQAAHTRSYCMFLCNRSSNVITSSGVTVIQLIENNCRPAFFSKRIISAVVLSGSAEVSKSVLKEGLAWNQPWWPENRL